MTTEKTAQTPRLSVAMIVRDAESSLTVTLDSVRELADEIIVADTGSVDRTRHVASPRASRVVTIPWTDDFSAARNACWRNITGDWVLWLDAGETIDAETAAEIRRFIDEDADRKHAYLLFVRVAGQNDSIAGEQVGRIRLVPNLEALRFSGRVHETLQPAINTLGLTVEPMSWVIHRDAASHHGEAKSRKARRDLKLAELALRDHGPTAQALIAMGEAWSNLGESRQAVDCFRRAIEKAGRGTTEMLEAYYGILAAYDGFDLRPGENVRSGAGAIAGQPDHRESQMQICLEALDIFPYDAQLLCAMANYLQARGRVDLACRSYQAAMQHGHVNLETWHLVAIREVAVTCLSLTLEQISQDDEARRVVEEVLAAEPGAVRLRRRAIDLCVKHNLRREALEHVSRLPDDTPHLALLRTAVRGACLAASGDWVSARAYLQTAYDGGCRDGLCLRWLAITMVSTGDYAAAQPIVDEWLLAAPASAEARQYAEILAAQSGVPVASPSAAAPRLLRVDGPDVPGASHLGVKASEKRLT